MSGFTDFRKAFDSVSHVKLLQKLRSYGIDQKLINWIQDSPLNTAAQLDNLQ